jgi:parallel beta-helix repeat protein
VIGADDITLDLNGHMIDGDGTDFAGCGKEEICDVGVLNDGHNEVTVRDGSMRQFWVGDSILGARGNRVRDISSSRNRFFGLLLFRVARSVIRETSGRRNIAPDGDGMGLFDSRRVRIVDSSFRHNSGPGIHVGESNENVITGNVFSHNGPAISIQGDRNQVRHNRVVGGGGILVAPGDRNVIARNRISRADDSLAIEKGHGNLVTRNLVVRARGEGIRLGIGAPAVGAPTTSSVGIWS